MVISYKLIINPTSLSEKHFCGGGTQTRRNGGLLCQSDSVWRSQAEQNLRLMHFFLQSPKHTISHRAHVHVEFTVSITMTEPEQLANFNLRTNNRYALSVYKGLWWFWNTNSDINTDKMPKVAEKFKYSNIFFVKTKLSKLFSLGLPLDVHKKLSQAPFNLRDNIL